MRQLVLSILVACPLFGQFVSSTGDISVLGIRVSFQPDNDPSTTGNGTFLTELTSEACGEYFIDPPPHGQAYFEAQLRAADSYFRSVSRGSFGISQDSRIFPHNDEFGSYSLDTSMAYFHPFADEDLQDRRLAELFRASLEKAYETDSLDFSEFDIIAIFHAGIGQDFALPFLDPTPQDIPSAYIDSDFLMEQLDISEISFPDGNSVSSGIILPETQNHLLYDIADQIFVGISSPCDYQFAMTGTVALMLGFAIGLPPLWDTESGESGAGVFALMDQGSNNGRGVIPAPPDPWTRIYAEWESPTVIRPKENVELIARDSLANEIVRVDINRSEYFLIENRNNWAVNGVDIDSMRWRNRTADGIMPTYAEILVDSVDVDIDSLSRVITSVPDYDLGLPGSGLLIWHIDEDKIDEGLNSYSVNGDREHRGLDLEEADGAQDIGYTSTGFWSDMWFAGNSKYYVANPGFRGQPPSFGPDTHPNTRSYGGADSYIEINNISGPGNIMSFSVDNSLMAHDFPDTSLHIHFFYDFTGDGKPQIIGGMDSLWWSPSDSLHRHPFFELPSDSFHIAVTDYEAPEPGLTAVCRIGESNVVFLFSFDKNEGNFNLRWSQTVVSNLLTPPRLPVLVEGLPDTDMVNLLWRWSGALVSETVIDPYPRGAESFDPIRAVRALIRDSWTGSSDSLFAEITADGQLFVTTDSLTLSGLENLGLETISTIDLDRDGKAEILASDRKGTVYAFNANMTMESGFPVPLNATSAVLGRDLLGNAHPELVIQADSSDILVLDWQGEVLYRLANPKGSQLRMLGQYQGRNSIASESAVWLFDSLSVTQGNEWSYVHGDPANRRRLEASLDTTPVMTERLIDSRRTYNYPNPAKKNSTTIRVFVESAERIEIIIYDVAGFYIDTLTMESPVRGEINEVVWDVSGVDSGVYFANVLATRGVKSQNKILKISVVH